MSQERFPRRRKSNPKSSMNPNERN